MNIVSAEVVKNSILLKLSSFCFESGDFWWFQTIFNQLSSGGGFWALSCLDEYRFYFFLFCKRWRNWSTKRGRAVKWTGWFLPIYFSFVFFKLERTSLFILTFRVLDSNILKFANWIRIIFSASLNGDYSRDVKKCDCVILLKSAKFWLIQ